MRWGEGPGPGWGLEGEMTGLWVPGVEGDLPQGQPHSWQNGFSAATASLGRRSEKGLRKVFLIKKQEKNTLLS